MLETSSSKDLEYVSAPRKRKKRGRLLYSNKRVLDRSRMRASKQMTRLTGVHNSLAVKIDFGEEEVTNLASLPELPTPEVAVQGTCEDNSRLQGNKTTQPIVSQCLLMHFL
jgi:hypothetical protein